MQNIVDISCGNKTSEEATISLNLQLGSETDVCADVLSLPFQDESLDGIIAQHFIEHLSPINARRFLEQSFYALRPGAFIRVSCPDMEKMCQSYLHLLSERNYEELDNLTHNFYGGQNDEFDFHLFGYHKESLRRLLIGAGFTIIDTVAPGDIHEMCLIAWKPGEETEELLLTWSIVSES